MCTNCSRLSLDLQNCDKCGNALSAENSVGCYSSEPKRARTDAEAPSPPSNGSIVNGNGPSSDAPSPDTSNAPPVPVPQALYKNKNVVDDTVSVRPQALFTNLTTTAAPTATLPASVVSSSSLTTLLSVGGGSGTASSAVVPPSVNNLLQSARQQQQSSNQLPSGLDTATAAALSGALAGGGVAQSNHPRLLPAPPMQQTSPRVSAVPPSYNLQPPAPPQYPLSSVQRPIENSPAGMGPITNNSTSAAATNAVGSSSGAQQVHKLIVEPNCVILPAQQIRIGSQKFKPISDVSFKDDGILFTLKGQYEIETIFLLVKRFENKS